MKKILITGATGLIGSALLEKVLESGLYECFVLTRREIAIPNAHVIVHNLVNPLPLQTLPARLDYVIHLAQAEDHNAFPENSERILSLNVNGMLQLLNYAVRSNVKKFIFASSGGIYGACGEPLKEDMKISSANNLGFYQNTKLCSEIIAQCYKPYFDIITLRIFFAYGPGQKATMLFPRLVKNVLEHNEIKIRSRNGIKMNPIYVADAAECIYKAMDIEGSQVFNIAGLQMIGLDEIVRIMGRYLKTEPRITFSDDGQPDVIADTEKMRRLLAVPSVGMEEGIYRLLHGEEGNGRRI